MQLYLIDSYQLKDINSWEIYVIPACCSSALCSGCSALSFHPGCIMTTEEILSACNTANSRSSFDSGRPNMSAEHIRHLKDLHDRNQFIRVRVQHLSEYQQTIINEFFEKYKVSTAGGTTFVPAPGAVPKED
ncbi:hypothetical protein SRHO_G00009230 [Serrasalmus rhombeus]